MQKPKKFITRMVLFLILVIALVGVLHGMLQTAFVANPGLNGVILTVLAVGIFYAFRRVFDLFGEITWIAAFKRQSLDGASVGPLTPPRLMGPAASLLAKSAEGRMQLSALSMRSVLDGIASRLEESREISRYLTGLLIFLGLLGTFWGLLGTIGSIGNTINGLTVDGTDAALMFDELKAGLEAPLAGMGTAFSSSLFGLAGSLILGFMDLQASQAQTRFYNDVEEWLASVTHLSRGGGMSEEGAMASPNSYMTALMEQTADGIDKLARTMSRADDGRLQLQSSMTEVAQAIASLGDQNRRQEEQDTTHSRALAVAIEKLANKQTGGSGMDEASRTHIRNIDVGLKRLLEEQSRANDLLVDELRNELKLLARTIAGAMDAQSSTRPSGNQPIDVTSEPQAVKPTMPTVSPEDKV